MIATTADPAGKWTGWQGIRPHGRQGPPPSTLLSDTLFCVAVHLYESRTDTMADKIYKEDELAQESEKGDVLAVTGHAVDLDIVPADEEKHAKQ